MTVIRQSSFGSTASGQPVSLFTLDNGSASASITNYGGTLVSLIVPDKNGSPVDVVLGYDSIADYERADKYIGALVGRYANRIGDAKFQLNGKTYQLSPNDGGRHHLHGGKIGFDRKVWDARTENGALILSYVSPDGEENYPGTLKVTVTYSLSDDNTLTLDYQAVCDQDTICNLTNHTYFNLAGQDSGTILDQWIQLDADSFTPANEKSIPDGAIASVEGTPMDLRQPVRIGEHIDDPMDQLAWAGGYDHNFIVSGKPGTLRRMAYAFDKGTGITLTGYTTLPGVQFYCGNYLDGVVPGKGKSTNGRRCGFCLESQFYPNSINCPSFPQPILRAGEQYHQVTAYKLGLL